MNDTQDETTTESEVTEQEAAQQDSAEDMVAEDRGNSEEKPKRGKRGLVLLLLLLIIGAGAVAAWHYQSMWMPQAKVLVAKWWPSEEEPDPLAAPAVDDKYLGKSADTTGYVLKAIPDPQPMSNEPAETTAVSEETATAEVASETAEPEVSKPTEAMETTGAIADAGPASTGTGEDTTESATADQTTGQAMADGEAAQLAMADSEPASGAADISQEGQSATASSTTGPTEMAVNKAMPAENATQVATLEQARQAYWSRNLVMAESMYRQVLASDDSSADAWGELGNVYYMQAKWQLAAEAYAEASVRLLQKGDFRQAMYMRYIVMGLDPAQARRVDQELQRMQAPAVTN